MLNWIFTGRISFAAINDDGSSGDPTSKEIHVLADMLDLTSLKELAMYDFRSRITYENAVKEFFSDYALLHKEFQNNITDVIDEKWSEIKAAGGHRILTSIIEAAKEDEQKHKLVMESVNALLELL